jgi:hypothetical protein
MFQYSCNVTLKLRGPIITKSTAAGKYGIDAPFARNEKNQLCLPLDLVRGRLKQAMVEINEAVGGSFSQSISSWFGEVSNETIGSYVPDRARLNFTDFIYNGVSKDNQIFRIRIDSERGSVQQGAYQVVEAPFQSGEEVDFAGTISFFAVDQNSANQIGKTIHQCLSWITSFGSQKSIGFGQLISVSATTPLQAQPKSFGTSVTSSDETHFDLALSPKALFCLTSGQIDQNLFESDDSISGGALKGLIATTWLKLLGQNGDVRAGVDPSRPELCQSFDKIRFTHAFPAKRPTRKRPVTIPYSIVADRAGRLHDVSLFAEPVLIDGSAPSFFMDWKRKVSDMANVAFRWELPKHKLDVHHQHDRKKRKAEEAKLFAYDSVSPHEHEWLCTVDLSRIAAPDRGHAATQLRDLLGNQLMDLGKTKAGVEVDWLGKDAFTRSHESNTSIRDGRWIITLQTDALLCDPSELSETSGAAELKKAYELVWDELSGGSLKLAYYFAGQHLAGGRYLHQRFQSGKPYNPFLLTNAGSVFVLNPTAGNDEKAKATIEDWLAHGLPLPTWASERYKRNNETGDHWSNCPYIPENGYGEIAVNLETHWSLKPEGGYDEV